MSLRNLATLIKNHYWQGNLEWMWLANFKMSHPYNIPVRRTFLGIPPLNNIAHHGVIQNQPTSIQTTSTVLPFLDVISYPMYFHRLFLRLAVINGTVNTPKWTIGKVHECYVFKSTEGLDVYERSIFGNWYDKTLGTSYLLSYYDQQLKENYFKLAIQEYESNLGQGWATGRPDVCWNVAYDAINTDSAKAAKPGWVVSTHGQFHIFKIKNEEGKLYARSIYGHWFRVTSNGWCCMETTGESELAEEDFDMYVEPYKCFQRHELHEHELNPQEQRTYAETVCSGSDSSKRSFTSSLTQFLRINSDETSQVFKDIQQNCRIHYAEIKEKIHFPWFESESRLDNWVHDLSIVTICPSYKYVSSRDGFLKDIFNAKTILMTGNPGFGKTTLCHFLAHLWSCSEVPMKDFGLCLMFNLKDIVFHTVDITEGIIIAIMRIVNNYRIGKDKLKDALKSHSKHVVLILDGYDELSTDYKNRMQNFILSRDDTVFKESTVIITTRPIVDQGFPLLFSCHVEIKPFSSKHLSFLLSVSCLDKSRVITFDNLFRKAKKLEYLGNISPLFTYYIRTVIALGQFRNENKSTLFDVLDLAMNLINQRKYSRSSLSKDFNLEEFFNTIGKLFLRALVKGQTVFTEDLLKRELKDAFMHAANCQIFIQVRMEQPSTNLWEAPSKILMVYFATKYLRLIWSQQKTYLDQEQFIHKYILFGDCTGDYVVGGSVEPSLLFVGLLPEIVLNFGQKFNFSQVIIDMYYDVERIEHTHAFDSTNLLLRIGKTYLSKFNFLEIRKPNDPKECCPYEKNLEYLISTLNFSDCTVNHSLFFNDFEDKLYLKVCVDNEKDECNVLNAVFKCKVNTVLEKVHIEFMFSRLDSVFTFLRSALSKCLPGFEMSDLTLYQNLSEFIHTLMCGIMSSNVPKRVWITCGVENNPVESTIFVQLVSRNLSEDCDINICISSFGPTTCSSSNFNFTKHDFIREKKYILKAFNDCFPQSKENLTVCIKLL